MLGDSLFGREIIFDAFRNNYFFFFLFFFFLLFSGKNCGGCRGSTCDLHHAAFQRDN